MRTTTYSLSLINNREDQLVGGIAILMGGLLTPDPKRFMTETISLFSESDALKKVFQGTEIRKQNYFAFVEEHLDNPYLWLIGWGIERDELYTSYQINGHSYQRLETVDNNIIIVKGGFGQENPQAYMDYVVWNCRSKVIESRQNYTVFSKKFHYTKIVLNRAKTRGNDDALNEEVEEYLCRNLDMDKLQPVNWIMGAAMFAKREFYNELGGFDEDYFLYMEDEDLCLRSWKAGKPVIFDGTTAVVHNHLRGSKKIGKKMFKHFQSLYTFFQKHGVNVKNYVES